MGSYVPTNTDYPVPPQFDYNVGGRPAEPVPTTSLSWFDVEVSWGGAWIDLNDKMRFMVSADSLGQAAVSWRKISADSPVAEGSYLIHAVKGMTTDRLVLYIYGQNHNDLNENIGRAEALFSQLDYRLRITFDDYREYWRCQPADWSLNRTHTMAHNLMATMELTIYRFPTVSRELVA